MTHLLDFLNMNTLTLADKIALWTLASIQTGRYPKPELNWEKVFKEKTKKIFKFWIEEKIKIEEVARLTREWIEVSKAT